MVAIDAKAAIAGYLGDVVSWSQVDVCDSAFRQQHREDFARRTVTEQLPQRLLVIGDPMPFDQFDKIPLGVAAQCGFAEMRIRRKKALRRNFAIGKVAPPAARDEDLRT